MGKGYSLACKKCGYRISVHSDSRTDYLTDRHDPSADLRNASSCATIPYLAFFRKDCSHEQMPCLSASGCDTLYMTRRRLYGLYA